MQVGSLVAQKVHLTPCQHRNDSSRCSLLQPMTWCDQTDHCSLLLRLPRPLLSSFNPALIPQSELNAVQLSLYLSSHGSVLGNSFQSALLPDSPYCPTQLYNSKDAIWQDTATSTFVLSATWPTVACKKYDPPNSHGETPQTDTILPSQAHRLPKQCYSNALMPSPFLCPLLLCSCGRGPAVQLIS